MNRFGSSSRSAERGKTPSVIGTVTVLPVRSSVMVMVSGTSATLMTTPDRLFLRRTPRDSVVQTRTPIRGRHGCPKRRGSRMLRACDWRSLAAGARHVVAAVAALTLASLPGCVADPGVRIAPPPTSWPTPGARRSSAMPSRASFLRFRGLTAWTDERSPVSEWSAEHAAEVVSVGPRWTRRIERIVRIEDAEPDQLLPAFELLADQSPLWDTQPR